MKILVTIICLALAASRLNSGSLEPTASLRVTDRYGNTLRSFLTEKATSSFPVTLAEISPWAVLATLAAEDKRFWEHLGIDPEAVARALGQDLRRGRIVSGASTLTQQLERSLQPRPRTLWGKIKEATGAIRIERDHSKSEILEAYFNNSPYGGHNQGIEAASESYFGIHASQLSLAQAALLAGVPNGPTRFDPLNRRKSAQKRQGWILGRLEAEGWVDAATLSLARQERLVVLAPQRIFEAPHFCEELKRWRPGAQGELKTTLDGPLQQDLTDLLRSHLANLVGQNVGQAALVVLDNHDGGVLAWIGSSDYFDSDSGQVDGVLARRQPGSALKPFLYALGFSSGLNPSDLVDDAPYTNPGGFSPRNYDRGYHGRVSLRQALACSYNIPAVKMIEKIGVDPVYSEFRRFGLRSLDLGADHYGPALALGDGEVTLLELATAYAALAREGLWRPARLTSSDAVPLEWPRAPRQRVMDAGSCFQVLDILSDNQARTPAFGADSVLRLPFNIAVKTGTTKDYRDNWCVGTTPEWTIAVWVGNPSGKPMRRVSGVSGAGPLFHDAAMRIARDRPPSDFDIPSGLKREAVCLSTGRLSDGNCGATNDIWIQERFSGELLQGGIALLDPAGGRQASRIEFPRKGEVFVVDPQASNGEQTFRPRAAGLSPEKLAWILDGVPLTSHEPWVPLKEGRHVLTLMAAGEIDPVDEVVYSVLE